MKKNIGSIDRTIRLVVAALIAILYFTDVISGTFAAILLVLGAIFVLTSAVGTCPIYLAVGLSTKKEEDNK